MINLALNTLFYNDNIMHQIYITKGKFDLEYQIPKTLYSTLISIALNIILKLLALSNSDVISFKQNKNEKNDEKSEQNLFDKLKIKFIFYFIISYILLFFLGYYICSFCAIYSNTQIHLIKDTMISFFLSLLYPFIINLLPGLFRIPSLSKAKKKRICMYKFSKILQIF